MRRLLIVLTFLAARTAWADDARPELIVKPDALRTLVNPNCSHCRDEAKRRASELRDDDRVLCWIRGYSDGGAIPLRFFLNPYRVISDTYGVFVFDADAGFARGFAPSLDFRFYGWRNGVMVMRHKDGSLFSCLTGVAFDGPQKGTQLPRVPTLVSNWGFVMKHYPQKVAYHMYEKYVPVELPDAPNAGSLKSRGKPDPRLPVETPVLGVVVGAAERAYPAGQLEKHTLLRDQLGGKSIVVLTDVSTGTSAAYEPVASPGKKEAGEPRAVTLTLAPKDAPAPFLDKETGSHWDVTGRAVDGQLKGWGLNWLDSTQVRWFAWAAEYPQTSIFQP